MVCIDRDGHADSIWCVREDFVVIGYGIDKTHSRFADATEDE